MATGDHTVHVNTGTVMANAGCEDCHVSTSSDGSTVTGAALHVNEVKDVLCRNTEGMRGTVKFLDSVFGFC